MAQTSISSDNQIEQWADDYFSEYVRSNPFISLMGTSENSPIQVKQDLTKKPGDKITFQMVTRLTGAGITGDNTLEGNEEALNNYGQQVQIAQIRNAVVIGSNEQIKSNIDIADAGKVMLKIWAQEQLRDLCLGRMMSHTVDGLTAYSASTVAERNAFSVAQNPSTSNQRLLYGAAKGNWSGVHATDMANVDGTADDLAPAIVRLAKRLAQSCSPHIRPVMVGGSESSVGGERFYMLSGSLAFRDLQTNSDSIHQAALAGESAKNPIFTGDSIKIGNVTVIEVPEMDRDATSVLGGCWLDNAGNGGTTDIAANFLVGAQAVLLAWGSKTKVVTKDFDYDNQHGVAVAEIRGAEKAMFNSYQNMVTVWTSAVGD